MLGFLFSFLLLLSPIAYADTSTSTVQAQIDETSNKIAQLQAEIARLQGQLNTTSKQKQTLQGAIDALNLNIKKLQKSITLTQTQIKQKDTQIGTLGVTIATTSNAIEISQSEVADSLRQLYQLDEEPLGLALLAQGTLSAFFDRSLTLETMRVELQNKIEDLSSLKSSLQTNKSAAELKRKDLANLQQNLNQQKQGVAITRDTQNQLLSETKNKESSYQALIAQKKAQEQQFENDLAQFESQLKLTVGGLPKAGTASLAWPVDNPYITQYFGNTPFATQHPQVYNGRGHNAIDLRASPGTPIKAARGGVVLGTGNTDTTCPNASYGKWIFIQHDNGLSTLYAHLSVIGVSQGDTIATGQAIGYSDTTGYATGPHLHFGVYASSGSEIASFASRSCKGRTFTMPVASIDAYLNPLSYLPAL